MNCRSGLCRRAAASKPSDIDQSALLTFTAGALQLNSNWCAADHESPAGQQAIAQRLGIYNSSRTEELTFSYPAAASTPSAALAPQDRRAGH